MLNIEKLKKMVRALIATRDDEIGCMACFQELDAFVEMNLQGKAADEARPLVKAHLEMCGDCREEYEALLLAIQAAEA